LPAARFPCFNEGRRIVHRDGHVEVDKAYYSVPPEYLGRQVWVQWDNHLVRVLNQRQQSIAVQRQPGCFSTQNKHIPLEKPAPSSMAPSGSWARCVAWACRRRAGPRP
jgi:Mu transposase, C-terminal domain